MEVILKEDIKSVGKAGEVIKVSPGFARNFLLPQGKAALANPQNLKELEHHKRAIQAKQEKLKKQAVQLAEKISALSLTIKKEAGEEEKLFGSVTNKELAEALQKEGIAIDRRQIQLEDPIKTIGVFDVPVRLHSEVTTHLKVWVVKS